MNSWNIDGTNVHRYELHIDGAANISEISIIVQEHRHFKDVHPSQRYILSHQVYLNSALI